ncbi:hypothetical protein [Nitrospira moscoviensis]|nr:hypothetical protein [Nitrospira moscoviensis]
MVQASQDGEIATYRPPLTRTPPPPMEIPVVRAAPFGVARTEMEPVNPWLGVRDVAAGTERPPDGLRIEYDTRGIVRDVQR